MIITNSPIPIPPEHSQEIQRQFATLRDYAPFQALVLERTGLTEMPDLRISICVGADNEPFIGFIIKNPAPAGEFVPEYLYFRIRWEEMDEPMQDSVMQDAVGTDLPVMQSAVVSALSHHPRLIFSTEPPPVAPALPKVPKPARLEYPAAPKKKRKIKSDSPGFAGQRELWRKIFELEEQLKNRQTGSRRSPAALP